MRLLQMGKEGADGNMVDKEDGMVEATWDEGLKRNHHKGIKQRMMVRR